MRIELPSGLVGEVRKIRGSEIVALAENSDDGTTGFAKLIASCWNETISNGPYPYVQIGDAKIPWHRILKGDFLYSFIFLRMISLRNGNDYDVKLKCSECEKEFEWTIPLNELPKQILPEESKAKLLKGESFKHTLSSGEVIAFDLQYMDQEEQIAEFMRKKDQKKVTFIHTLASQILTIDGKTLSFAKRFEFVSDLELDLLSELQEAMSAHDCGVDTEIHVRCTKCKHVQAITLPLGKSFFSLAAKSKPKTEG